MSIAESGISFLLALSGGVLLAGCASSGRIDTETAPTADFSSRHTFAWQESQASYDPQPKPQDVEQVKAAIHEAVVTQLSQKGYSEASSKTPDFLVSFHLVVTETAAPDLCIRRHMIFEWPSARTSPDTFDVCERDPTMLSRPVRKGTLVVFVVDAATRSLLWQGVADQATGSRKDQIEKLRSAVERMFATFPAQSA